MKGAKTKMGLSAEQREELLKTLKSRFEANMNRHEGLEWAKVKAKLEANVEKLWSLNEMERTGVNRILLVMIKRRANISSLIVRRKLPGVG